MRACVCIFCRDMYTHARADAVRSVHVCTCIRSFVCLQGLSQWLLDSLKSGARALWAPGDWLCSRLQRGLWGTG